MTKIQKQIDQLSYCGGLCANCPRYWLSLQEDSQKILAMQVCVAAYEKEMWGIEAPAEEFGSCQGCKGSGERTTYCDICQIRSCAIARGMPTCGHCVDYPHCEIIQQHLARHTALDRAHLDLIRSSL